MSAPIGSGDMVECVDAGPLRFLGIWPSRTPSGLTAGAIYVVRYVCLAPNLPAWARRLVGACVALRGVRRPDGGMGWGVKRFRPVYRPRSSFIDGLKQPAPKREPENA